MVNAASVGGYRLRRRAGKLKTLCLAVANGVEVNVSQKFRLATVVRAISIFAVLIVFDGSLTRSAYAGDAKDVRLWLAFETTGRAVIIVDPSYAKIWRNKPDKPKKVNWDTVNNSQYEELFWELRYDPSKGGASADYFGDVDIVCGETAIKVQPEKKPDFPNAQWPYAVSVYACKNGVKAQKLACVDPRIVWKD